jgi:hypothetical protein
MKRAIPEDAVVCFFHGRRMPGGVGIWYRSKGTRGDLKSWKEEPVKPLARGGRTECCVTLADGTEVWGVAECSQQDNYSKKIGRDIALGRALKRLAAKE